MESNLNLILRGCLLFFGGRFLHPTIPLSFPPPHQINHVCRIRQIAILYLVQLVNVLIKIKKRPLMLQIIMPLLQFLYLTQPIFLLFFALPLFIPLDNLDHLRLISLRIIILLQIIKTIKCTLRIKKAIRPLTRLQPLPHSLQVRKRLRASAHGDGGGGSGGWLLGGW